jgi:hypothetical protein
MVVNCHAGVHSLLHIANTYVHSACDEEEDTIFMAGATASVYESCGIVCGVLSRKSGNI